MISIASVVVGNKVLHSPRGQNTGSPSSNLPLAIARVVRIAVIASLAMALRMGRQ